MGRTSAVKVSLVLPVAPDKRVKAVSRTGNYERYDPTEGAPFPEGEVWRGLVACPKAGTERMGFRKAGKEMKVSVGDEARNRDTPSSTVPCQLQLPFDDSPSQ